MTLLIFYASLAIGVSFLCSMLEAGLLSVPRSYVEALVQRNSWTGRTLKRMKDNIDRPLSAILTLNTVAHTVGAAGVGAQAAVVFGDAAVGAASALMTLLILVLSEIIPKTLGAVHNKRLAPMTAMTALTMMVLTWPIVVALESLNRLIGGGKQHEGLSRAELLATLRMGHKGGALGENEYRALSNLLTLSKVSLERVMTPRTVLFALPKKLTVAEVREDLGPLRFARIPVYGHDLDEVTGYVPRFEIQKAIADENSDKTLEELSREIPAMPESLPVSRALEKMLSGHHQISLVVDEYGGVEGIVTLEDLLETLLGREIVDETDIATDMQVLAKQKANQMHGRSAEQADIAPEDQAVAAEDKDD